MASALNTSTGMSALGPGNKPLAKNFIRCFENEIDDVLEMSECIDV